MCMAFRIYSHVIKTLIKKVLDAGRSGSEIGLIIESLIIAECMEIAVWLNKVVAHVILNSKQRDNMKVSHRHSLYLPKSSRDKRRISNCNMAHLS